MGKIREIEVSCLIEFVFEEVETSLFEVGVVKVNGGGYFIFADCPESDVYSLFLNNIIGIGGGVGRRW